MTAEAERSIFYPANDFKPLAVDLLEPAFQLSLSPVAARHQENTTLANQRQHTLTVTFA
jgi:hypothetical protein